MKPIYQKLLPSLGEKEARPNQKPRKKPRVRMAKEEVVPGKLIGRLTVTEVNRNQVKAMCSCGTPWKGTRSALRIGNTRSCGCLKRDTAGDHARKHGHRVGRKRSKVYRAWQNMKERCLNPNNSCWEQYGGRGITVCERWLNFELFAKDIGEPPTRLHTIERVDNSKGYSPDNIRWATRLEQGNNKRNNVHLTAFGVTKTLPEWARQIGLHEAALRDRIYRGWPVEKALTQPSKKQITL